MRRTVILRHTRDGFPDHFDWLIDQPDLPMDHRLITYRVPSRPDQQREFMAEKAPDHRAIYLEYEGELSENRGRVVRVAQGIVNLWESDEQRIRCELNWGQHTHLLSGTRMDGQWSFRRID